MSENIFGTYLKSVRQRQSKTQQQLADAIGKHKMLISGIEKGHNNPPRTEDLEKLIAALELSSEERLEFLDKAALHRHSVPDDILDFLLSEPHMRDVIRTAQSHGMTNQKYAKMLKIVQEG